MAFSKTALSVFLLTFFSTTVPTLAVGRPLISPRQGIKQEIKEDIEATRATTKITATANRLTLRRQNAQKIAAKMRLQFTNRLTYLNKIKAQLQNKIDKFKGTRDMAPAITELAKYDSSPTSKYGLALADFDSIIAKIDTSDKPQTVIPELRASAKNVLKELKNLHQTLINTLKLIVKAPKPTATPTI